jgi:hypothetical protein
MAIQCLPYLIITCVSFVEILWNRCKMRCLVGQIKHTLWAVRRQQMRHLSLRDLAFDFGSRNAQGRQADLLHASERQSVVHAEPTSGDSGQAGRLRRHSTLRGAPKDIHNTRERLKSLGYGVSELEHRDYGQTEFFLTDDDGYSHRFGVPSQDRQFRRLAPHWSEEKAGDRLLNTC